MRDESSGSASLPRYVIRHRDAIKAVLALLFLNAMLSFSLWWPTPAIRPAPRLAPEFVLFRVLLLVTVRVAGALSRRIPATAHARGFQHWLPAARGRPLCRRRRASVVRP
jgi:hypothetical protein